MEANKGDAALSLSVNSSDLMLNQKQSSDDALVFSWTTGSNHGTNASINYRILIDKQGNNFDSAVSEELGSNTLVKKYTVSDLNNLLLTQLHVQPGTKTTIEAKILIDVTDHEELAEQSNVITVAVTPYDPVATTLYLIGDATPNGWSADNATAMTANTTEPGKFSWQGLLSVGDFKFITTLGQFLPSYNKGSDDSHLVYRTADTQPDEKFHISSPAVYTVSVSLLDSTIAISVADVPTYSRLWIVGDATPNGWNIDQPNEMRVDSSNLFLFRYNEILKAGEFKIPVSTGNWGTDYYMPLTNHPDLSETTTALVHGGSPDNKWLITNAGPYKITLDIQNLKIGIQPFTPYTHIWIVGDATPNGWDIDNPNVMTPDPNDPYVFTYTGHLNVGEFKFPLSTGNWGCDYFMPVIAGSTMGSSQMKFTPGGNPDNKWKITQAGNYKITINQLYETISIEML